MGKVVNSDFFKSKADDNKPAEKPASKPAPNAAKPAPNAAKPAANAAKPAPNTTKPAPNTTKPVPNAAKPAPNAAKPAPNVAKPAPNAAKLATNAAKLATNAAKPVAPAKPGNKPVIKEIGRKRVSPMRINKAVMNALKQTSAVLDSCGHKKAAKEIENIYMRGTRNVFTVAVVGEFSRGKSTFINGLIGKDILPVGDLPTTAMLTRIRYNSKDTMVHIDLEGNMISVPPVQDSWDGLVADNFGHCDPEGMVHMGLKNQWLGENGIEIMDTPGAGDLEEKRAQLIGEALLGSDGAIITVSAASPLSLTEKTFIEERLISRKTPFLMLIITKLDTIPVKERKGVVEYIISKLRSWKLDIPVYIPLKLETEGNAFQEIMGYDKIKEQMFKWINDPKRVKLTEAWLSAQALSVLQRETENVRSQVELLEIDDEKKRSELIEAKKQGLQKAEEVWTNLCNEMKNRSNMCLSKVAEKANEFADTIIERLQHEISHAANPEKWWKEDYPYRLKIELTNMSVAVTNTMSRTVAEDTRWLNAAFEQNFKSRLLVNPQEIVAEKNVNGGVDTNSMSFSDVDKQRKAVKIGSSVLTIVGASATVALKMSSLVWTMGVGTCISLLSEAIFKKELDDQRDKLKRKIADDIPQVINESMVKTGSKVDMIYDDIMRSAEEKKKSWIEAQTEAIEKSTKVQGSSDKDILKKNLKVLEEIQEKLT